MAIYSEFSHETWWFSIVMLVYQRVLSVTHILVESETRDKYPSTLQYSDITEYPHIYTGRGSLVG